MHSNEYESIDICIQFIRTNNIPKKNIQPNNNKQKKQKNTLQPPYQPLGWSYRYVYTNMSISVVHLAWFVHLVLNKKHIRFMDPLCGGNTVCVCVEGLG